MSSDAYPVPEANPLRDGHGPNASVPTREQVGHWDIESFRRHGYAMIDMICSYQSSLESRPVLSQVTPGFLSQHIPTSAPLESESFDTIMKDIQSFIIPGLTHWSHPRFFAYFPASASGPSILGELLSQAFNVIGFSWISSPAATELETIVMDWLAQACRLPTEFTSKGTGVGIIQGTASESSLVAMLVAQRETISRHVTKHRQQHPEDPITDDALITSITSRLLVYTSDQTHSSLKKACMILGIHDSRCRVIPTSSHTHYTMPVDKLTAQLQSDVKQGLIPCFACFTYGTTGTGAIDDIEVLAPVCKQYDVYVHVDGAWAGVTWLLEEYRYLLMGKHGKALEYVDSLCFNPHKWMLVNFDCSAMWVRSRSSVYSALSLTPEYLRNEATDSGCVIDYRDMQIPLGRRFRSLKLWMVMRTYGIKGLCAHIRFHLHLTTQLESWIREDSRFEIVVPRSFGLLVFRLCHARDASGHITNDITTLNTTNQHLLDTLNHSGFAFLTHMKLDDRFVIRWSIGSAHVEESHVRSTWDRIRELADEYAPR